MESLTAVQETAYRDFQEAADAVVTAIAAHLRRYLDETESAVLAVGGGRTPKLVLPHLAHQSCDWARVIVTLTDERCVAPEDPASNEGLVRESLMQGPAAASKFVGLSIGAPPPPPDLVYLGFGEDGHIASLFPEGPELQEHGDLVVASRAPVPPFRRMSMTMDTLLAARRIVILVAGPGKREAYFRARNELSSSASPLARVLGQKRCRVHVYLAEE